MTSTATQDEGQLWTDQRINKQADYYIDELYPDPGVWHLLCVAMTQVRDDLLARLRTVEQERDALRQRERAQVLTPDVVEALDTLLNSAEWELETAPADYHPETKEMVQSAIDTVRRIVDQLEAKRE